MSSVVIDGKAFARNMCTGLQARVDALKARGIQPGFAAILVGEHPPSMIYVANKQREMAKIGIDCRIERLPADIAQDELLKIIASLNDDKAVHGILVQMPLPSSLDTLTVINAVAPQKDVDGLTLDNVGKRTLGLESLLPCTPKGCLKLIKSVRADLAGLQAVVVGRSDLVGKPMAQLLLREDCTVTQAHAKTKDLPGLLKTADIVVVAAGRAQMVQGSWLKPGAIVIDVGINRVEGGLVGDMHFASAAQVAGAITPVPGGVGPMTIACLLENLVEAAEKACN